MSHSSRSTLPVQLAASAAAVLAFAVSLVAFRQGGVALHALGALAGLVSVGVTAGLIYLNHLSYMASDFDQQVAPRPVTTTKRKARE